MKFFKKVSFFKTHQFWFKGEWRPYHIFSLTAFLHIKSGKQKKPFCFQENSQTLELDINQDLDAIYSGFAKQVRQQTTHAVQDGIICKFHSDIKGFELFFNEFASKKGIFLTSERRLKEMMPYLQLAYAVKDDVVLAAHSYIFDREVGIVRHFHSSTKIPNETFDNKIIGKANKFLTCKCIEQFKKDGFSTFDFGGVVYPPDETLTAGIYNYKSLFGGTLQTCYNSYTPLYYFLKYAGKKFWFLGKKTTV